MSVLRPLFGSWRGQLLLIALGVAVLTVIFWREIAAAFGLYAAYRISRHAAGEAARRR